MTHSANIPRHLMLVWAGQMLSACGSAVTAFGLGLWVLRQADSVLGYSLVIVASVLPGILAAPLAGLVADRVDVRRIMIASEIGGVCIASVLLVLLTLDQLGIERVYVLSAVGSILLAFQSVAYQVAIGRALHKEDLARVNGMVQMSNAASHLAGPALGALLLASVGMQGILVLDLLSFVLATAAWLLVRTPLGPPAAALQGQASPASAQEQRGRIRVTGFLASHPQLMAVLAYFVAGHFVIGLVTSLAAPLVLAFHSERVLGTVLTLGGLGMLAGAGLAAARPPRRLLPTILAFHAVQGLAIAAAALMGHEAIALAGLAFIAFLCLPVIDSADQTLWHRKVPPVLHGRVFAIRHIVVMGSIPVAALAGGALADGVLIPYLRSSKPAARTLEHWFGSGQAGGVALLLFGAGLAITLLALAALSVRRFRRLDLDMPDGEEIHRRASPQPTRVTPSSA